MLVIVKLRKPVGPNNAGEVCGFEQDRAMQLIAAGRATIYRPPTPEAVEAQADGSAGLPAPEPGSALTDTPAPAPKQKPKRRRRACAESAR